MSNLRRQRDAGFTLPELLISIVVIGLIGTVLAAAVTVTLRQNADTQGRLAVARWEQSLALWLPLDLSSAADVDAEPTTTPCASAVCTFGSNALQLGWNDGSGDTTVSYRYGPSDAGTTFELVRVECAGGSCSSAVVLRDLSPPLDAAGNAIAWSSGDPVPSDVIDVTVPLAVTSDDPDGDSDDTSRASRVIVSVNGVPTADGTDRSSRVSFTAGGTSLGELDPTTFSGPSFLQANSGCGGPITLVVDESGSIGSNDSNVRSGVRSFVRAFDGTPTQLQIVEMYSFTSVLGAGGAWNKFFDLSEPSDVDALIGADGNSGLVSSIQTRSSPNFYTNWEDAMFRSFYASNGQTYDDFGSPAAPTPELVVFFTDGLPTRDRATSASDSAPSVGPATIPSRFNHTSSGGGAAAGSSLSPRGWYRADFIVDQFRDIRMIGVGVGSSFSQNTKVSYPGWPRNYFDYKNIPNEVFLGDLVAGNDPSAYDGTANYVKRTYSGGWSDVSTADLLVTSDFSQFGSALTEIALAECGGTLTVQTRESASGNPADADVTYQVDDNVVTTSRISKSGTFDIALAGVGSDTVQLIPQPFDDTGYTPSNWLCRAGGQDLTFGTEYSLINPADPSEGINVTVSANAAVSCTLYVS